MKSRKQIVETVEKLEISLGDIDQLMGPLSEYHAIFSPLFKRAEQRKWAEFYLQGLLSPSLDRKSIEPMVLNSKGANQNTVRAVQQFIGEGGWEDGPIRIRHWQEVDITLGEDDGVMIVMTTENSPASMVENSPTLVKVFDWVLGRDRRCGRGGINVMFDNGGDAVARLPRHD